MMFKPETQKKFREAGWFPERDVKDELKWPFYKDAYPAIIQDFLQEYGNLIIQGNGQFPPTIELFPNYGVESDPREGKIYREISEKTGNEYFIIGGFYSPPHDIVVDENLRVYLFGDYYFFYGRNLKEGIENILEHRSDLSLEFDYETGDWWTKDGKKVDFETYTAID